MVSRIPCQHSIGNDINSFQHYKLLIYERKKNKSENISTKNTGAGNAFGTNKKYFEDCTFHFIKRGIAVILIPFIVNKRRGIAYLKRKFNAC